MNQQSTSGRSGTRRRRRARGHRALLVGGCAVVGAGLAAAAWAGLVAGGSNSGRSASRVDGTAAPTTTTLPPPTTVPPTTVPPTLPPRAIAPVVANGPRDRPAVALTFDSNLTDAMIQELHSGKVASFANVAVLDELDQLHVPATIFLAGKWIEQYPDVTRRITADPLLEVGSHSYSHRAFHQPCYGLGTIRQSEMADDVNRSEALLRQYSTRPTPYFRFPGGCYDDAALRAVGPTGVIVIQYDLPSGDAFGTNVNAIVRNVLSNTRNGSIVVMHITGGNTAPLTALALPPIVNGLRQRGFQLVRLSDLLGATGTG